MDLAVILINLNKTYQQKKIKLKYKNNKLIINNYKMLIIINISNKNNKKVKVQAHLVNHQVHHKVLHNQDKIQVQERKKIDIFMQCYILKSIKSTL
jgi:hypothetical protein